MFRRRRRAADEFDEYDEEREPAPDVDLDDDDEWSDEDADESGPALTSGPWDLDDLPADDDTTRIDLGGLRVPAAEGVEMHVEMASPEGPLTNVTLAHGASRMQLSAFAAPRTSGIWDEVRDEIATSLRASGGAAEEAVGTFGTELHARVPSTAPGQGRVLQAARFMGVDGPRWFVRALLSGPAATDPVQATTLEDLFRRLVVVRGKEAMAPRDPIPLRLPRELLEPGAGDEAAAAPTLDRIERGPEIAETR